MWKKLKNQGCCELSPFDATYNIGADLADTSSHTHDVSIMAVPADNSAMICNSNPPTNYTIEAHGNKIDLTENGIVFIDRLSSLKRNFFKKKLIKAKKQR